MGLFNKTEEELKQEEIQRKYSLIINRIYDSSLSGELKNYLNSYMIKVRKGYPNDFDDLDTLIRIIYKLIDDRFDEYDFDDYFKMLINGYHLIVNKDSDDYETTKDLFIEYFAGYDGIVNKGLFDENLYAIFKDKKDYFELIISISKDENLSNKYLYIKDYILSVAPYCLNQDILKRDVISYLDGLSTVTDDDYKKYNANRIEIAKNRIGIYNLNPKELALAASELRKAERLIDQIQVYMASLRGERAAIDALVTSAKKEIKNQENASIDELTKIINGEVNKIINRLEAYLLDLEEALKLKSDETFKKVLEQYQAQVEEFRELFKGYSIATSKDFLAIQKASEESVRKLQEFVNADPHFTNLLARVEEEGSVRNKIVELVAKEEDFIKNGGKFESKDKDIVEIPGYNRLMVPYRHLVLPATISNTIVPALDGKIPFNKRLEAILERLESNEKNGVIYHKKTKEILVDIMEGDWPYLWGPSGTGKSYMMKQVAGLLGMNLRKAGKITEPYSVLGYNDPQGRYQITPSFVSVLYGDLLFLDELDNGNPDTQVVLNDIYSELLNKLENPNESYQITFGTDVIVDVHPNFRMASAGNTSGLGENEAFSSRGKMDESVSQRMTPIYIDYDNRIDEKILADYPTWYRFHTTFREACINYSEASSNGKESAQGITTTRDAAAIKRYIEHNSKEVDQIIREKFIQIKDSEYLKALARYVANKYGIDYSNCTNPKFNGPLSKVDDKVLAKKFIANCKEGIR